MVSSRVNARGPGADERRVSRDPIVNRLFWLRFERNWSQKGLAARALISDSVINQAERGLHNVRLDTVHRWAAALGYRLELVPNQTPPEAR